MEIKDIKAHKLKSLLESTLPDCKIVVSTTENLLRFVYSVEIEARTGEAWFENLTEFDLDNYLKNPETLKNLISNFPARKKNEHTRYSKKKNTQNI